MINKNLLIKPVAIEFKVLVDQGRGCFRQDAGDGFVYEYSNPAYRMIFMVSDLGFRLGSDDDIVKYNNVTGLESIPTLLEIRDIVMKKDVDRIIGFDVVSCEGKKRVDLPYWLYSVFQPFLAKSIKV